MIKRNGNMGAVVYFLNSILRFDHDKINLSYFYDNLNITDEN